MAGGRPAGVQISLSLQELQIETAADYGAPSTTEPGVTLDEEELAMNYQPDVYSNQGGGGFA
jgi:hypothetical protein